MEKPTTNKGKLSSAEARGKKATSLKTLKPKRRLSQEIRKVVGGGHGPKGPTA